MGSPSVRRATVALLAIAASLAAMDAGAWCRSTTCKGTDVCDGEPPQEGCVPLSWASGCVGFSVSDLGGSGLEPDEITTIVQQAFDAWRGADCGGGARPGIVIQDLGEVSCNAVEYNKHAANANIVLFNDGWEHPDAAHPYALTTTTFDPNTGELLNADIELNSDDFDFTTGDANVDVDLLSVLTHETGHFLGMAHNMVDGEATMFPYYMVGETGLRSLSPDDEAGICNAYPPRQDIDDTCNPLPRHGFSPECRDDQKEGDCSVAAPGAGAQPWALPLLAGAALALARRRAIRGRSEARGPSRGR